MEVVLPPANTRQENRHYLTSYSRVLKKNADTAHREGNLEQALIYYEDYLNIKADDTQVFNIVRTIRTKLQTESYSPTERKTAYEPAHRIVDLSGNELYHRALNFKEKEDYFSAHYYATRAYTIDPSLETAKRLAAKTWNLIGENTPTKEEIKNYEIHQKKLEGHQALMKEQYIDAYFLYLKLAQTVPNDADVQEYLHISKQKTEQITYYIDEARQSRSIPGIKKILFLENSKNKTLISIDHMVLTQRNTFFYDIEVISLTTDSDISFHLSSPYGILKDNYIVMYGIDRENKDIMMVPTYHTGKPEIIDHIIPLTIHKDELVFLSQQKDFITQLNILNLYQLRSILSNYGYKPISAEKEIIVRLLQPFSFIILSFFALSLGWGLRRKRNNFPFVTIVIFPLFVFIINLIVRSYEYINIVLYNTFLLLSGLSTTIALVFLTQAVILFFALIITAGQKT